MIRNDLSVIPVSLRFRHLMAAAFALIFFALSVILSAMSMHVLWNGLFGDANFTESFVKAINLAIIALAMFELGLVVSKEYTAEEDESNILQVLRRTVSRFVSIVCIALVLEGLLMVIKYSQLDLAGNLWCPVAIITSSAILLMALGVFLHFTAAPPAAPVSAVAPQIVHYDVRDLGEPSMPAAHAKHAASGL